MDKSNSEELCLSHVIIMLTDEINRLNNINCNLETRIAHIENDMMQMYGMIQELITPVKTLVLSHQNDVVNSPPREPIRPIEPIPAATSVRIVQRF